MPSSNVEYWSAKIARNTVRDEQHLRDLESRGWESVVIWECELPTAVEALVDRLNQIKLSITKAR